MIVLLVQNIGDWSLTNMEPIIGITPGELRYPNIGLRQIVCLSLVLLLLFFFFFFCNTSYQEEGGGGVTNHVNLNMKTPNTSNWYFNIARGLLVLYTLK